MGAFQCDLKVLNGFLAEKKGFVIIIYISPETKKLKTKQTSKKKKPAINYVFLC